MDHMEVWSLRTASQVEKIPFDLSFFASQKRPDGVVDQTHLSHCMRTYKGKFFLLVSASFYSQNLIERISRAAKSFVRGLFFLGRTEYCSMLKKAIFSVLSRLLENTIWIPLQEIGWDYPKILPPDWL